MAMSAAVRKRRESGKRWFIRFAKYIAVATPVMLVCWYALEPKNSFLLFSFVSVYFFLSRMFFVSIPLSFTATSLSVLPIPVWLTVPGILILAILPAAGARILCRGRFEGKYIAASGLIATITVNVFLTFFMYYSGDWVKIKGMTVTYMAITVSGILIPALELYFLNKWVPKESRNTVIL